MFCRSAWSLPTTPKASCSPASFKTSAARNSVQGTNARIQGAYGVLNGRGQDGTHLALVEQVSPCQVELTRGAVKTGGPVLVSPVKAGRPHQGVGDRKSLPTIEDKSRWDISADLETSRPEFMGFTFAESDSMSWMLVL